MNENRNVHSIRYNAFMNVILTAVSFAYPLVTFPYVSRVLLVEGNGKVNFAASVASYFAMIASLGIPTYGIRACAQVRDDQEKLSKTVQEILIINFVSTFLASIAYILCVFSIPKFRTDKTLFLIEGVNIVLNMFGANWLYQALEQYDYITVRSIIFKVLSVVLMFTFVHKESDYLIYAVTFVTASVGSNVLNFCRLHKYISFKRFQNYNLRQHMIPIFILFAQNLAVSLYTNLDTVMLGLIRDNIQVGLYTAATKFKGLLTGVVVSLGSVLLPRMSFYVEKKLKREFEILMVKAINTVLFLSMPIVVYFVVMSKDCISFIAGDSYFAAIPAMQIITFAVLPNGLTGILGVQVLTPLKRERYVLYSVIVGALSDFVLNSVLIPDYGAIGAAFATTVAEYLVLFTQIFLAKDILESLWKKFDVIKYLFSALLAMVPTYVPFALIKGNTFERLLFTAVVYAGIYAGVLYIQKDELLQKLIKVRK